MRHCYDVVYSGGEWEVGVPTQRPDASPRVRYHTREKALSGALRMAKAEWKATGHPTLVRVQAGFGHWVEARAFGDESAEPAPTVPEPSERASGR